MSMKHILMIAFTLAGLAGMAQTNQPLPSGAVPFGATTYLSPLDSTIWLYKERDGTAIKVANWVDVDSLFGLGYTKGQVDSAISAQKQVLSLSGSAGNISISDGNDVTLPSISVISRPNHNDESIPTSSGVAGFVWGTGSSGYTNSAGSGVYINRYSSASSNSGFILAKPGALSGDSLQYITWNGNNVYGTWKTFADREWVNARIPTDYINTTSNQSNIAGMKRYTSAHYWDMAAGNSAILLNKTGGGDNGLAIRWMNVGTDVSGIRGIANDRIEIYTGSFNQKMLISPLFMRAVNVYFEGVDSVNTRKFVLRINNSADGQLTLYSGGVSANGAYTNTSDSTIKNIVTDFDCSAVESLKATSFTYKDNRDSGRVHVGYIAQEVREVLPDAVYESEETGLLSVDHVQVIIAKLALLEERVKQLEARIEQLEN